jgi:hypothetical protein
MITSYWLLGLDRNLLFLMVRFAAVIRTMAHTHQMQVRVEQRRAEVYRQVTLFGIDGDFPPSMGGCVIDDTKLRFSPRWNCPDSGVKAAFGRGRRSGGA